MTVHNRQDDMRCDDFFTDEQHYILGGAATPVAPSEQLKAKIFAAIATDSPEDISPSHTRRGAKISDGNTIRVSFADRTHQLRPAKRIVFASAAAVAVFAGGAAWLASTDIRFGDSPNTLETASSIVAHDNSHHSRALSPDQDAYQQMKAILAFPDARHADMTARGARLEIAISQESHSGGAVINGAPHVPTGMGAQVWAIRSDGSMQSAGVINSEQHHRVWMPLPSDTRKVMVTEEPLSGSTYPAGHVLTEAIL